MTRAVVIPDTVLEIMRRAPKGAAGITIWETADGRWQVSIKRGDGSFNVKTEASIQGALNAFIDEDEVVEKRVRKAREEAAESPKRRRDLIGDEPPLFRQRRQFHLGD